MRAFSVAMLGDYFTSWMGGANILGVMMHNMMQAATAQNASIYLLMRHTQLPEALQREVQDFMPIPREKINASATMGCLLEHLPNIEHVLFYRDLPRTLEALNIDVVGPTGENLGAEFTRPWFAYIPDFQHQYLTRFFSQRERMQRDQHFRSLVENSAGVYVNSSTVVNDIQRFYAGSAQTRRVLRLPQLFYNVSTANADEALVNVRERLGVHRPYVLSCSQRWLHKQHEVIIGAFAEYLDAHPDSQLDLVFTGERSDYRNPGYAEAIQTMVQRLGLSERVHDLGLIERHDQLQLITCAQALLQASLFEGGPGASGMLEAALLGTPILASDIDANRELSFGDLRFFDRHSSRALATLLTQVDGPIRTERNPPFDAEQIAFLGIAGGLQMLATLRGAAHTPS